MKGLRGRLPKYIIALPPVVGSILSILQTTNIRAQVSVFWIGVFSLIGQLVCLRLIEVMKPLCLSKGLFGKDLAKTGDEKVPEAMGLVSGCVHALSMILLQPFFPDIPLFNAATTAITLTILTGFMDDVLDLKWKTKIALSFLATLPLLVAYDGPTNVIVPTPLRAWLGVSLELGVLYLAYMMFLSVFFTNSINIYAGINGLEVSQSVVIACCILLHNAFQMGLGIEAEANLFSICVILPFLASTLALMWNNWYPSKVFVGDTFTYTAGMTFAVCAILGKCSKTVMLFFIPQFINFFLSVPQILKLIPCPRHRVPVYVSNTDKLHYSSVEWKGKQFMNLTLINLFLFVFGDMNEEALCILLTTFQCLACGAAFVVRYYLATMVYENI